MSLKKNKSICGFCNEFCGNRWCPARLMIIPGCIEFFAKKENPCATIFEKESLTPSNNGRTESDNFLYDLIKQHGGGLHD